jgi:hypothetical protein
VRGAEELTDAAGAGLARLFGRLSHARGRRIFHPEGVGFRARLEPLGEGSGAMALDRPGEAIVRLSRALGLPEPLPDFLGLALRLPDAYGQDRHQDLLLVTSGRRPLARHTLLPARGFADLPYSSILPFRVAGELAVIGARGVATRPGPGLTELRGRDRAQISFTLALAPPGGEWRAAAVLALGERMNRAETERLAFDPGNTGGGLELAGLLNRLRIPGYEGSQKGRGPDLSSRGLRPGSRPEGSAPFPRRDP